MPHLTVDPLPELRDPLLVVSFGGWTDMGEAATAAARWLVRHLPARRTGSFDTEFFHIFRDTRPTVKVVEGERQITWPQHDLFVAAQTELPRDMLLLVAREPELRWRTYCRELLETAVRAQVQQVVTFGAFLADAPHSRPVPISGFATTVDWRSRLQDQGITLSDYQGPTGIVSVLHDTCREAGVPSFSLWAAVPHYLPTTANPKAALAILRRFDAMLGLGLDFARLEQAAVYFERQVNDAVGRDRRAASYLRELERRADQSGAEERTQASGPLPSAEEVIRDLEDFLRGRRET
jgi:predicted ATP-grasp superfamily ATP-dependent carboligase